jgi:hypothetical protein
MRRSFGAAVSSARSKSRLRRAALAFNIVLQSVDLLDTNSDEHARNDTVSSWVWANLTVENRVEGVLLSEGVDDDTERF